MSILCFPLFFREKDNANATQTKLKYVTPSDVNLEKFRILDLEINQINTFQFGSLSMILLSLYFTLIASWIFNKFLVFHVK